MTHTDKPLPIGRILVEQGVLSEQQVLEILQAQRRHALPFGLLAERMFEVTLESIERAWSEQFQHFSGLIDLDHEALDLQVLRLINRRQAWQFQIVPLRYEPSGELLVAASQARLARAVVFVAQKLTPIVLFRIAESEQLRRFLMAHYPMPEVSEALLRRGRELADDRAPAARRR